ncbi:MAG: DUF2264 domain-containing protein [Armatimonadaceae bacterium]
MKGEEVREYWIGMLERIAAPVLEAAASGRLKATMPMECHPAAADREQYTHLEAFARTLVGVAPWLDLPADGSAEGALRRRYAKLAQTGLRNIVHPDSPDRLNFEAGQQPLVDMAFLAQAIHRAPQALWHEVDSNTRDRLITAFRTARTRKPPFNNWLLFAAMIEAVLCKLGYDWDPMRVDYALRQHEQWYLGDGVYGDGPGFHADYYNSFVIHPMLVDILAALGPTSAWQEMSDPILRRARRYAALQERMISPGGTYPPVGRSLTYRFGVFHALAQMALLHQLPDGVSPASVRAALTAVLRRQMGATGTFNSDGWLCIGFCGAQPGMAEPYISTGSLYLCTGGLLPLGLPATDPFWSHPDEPWTSKRLWGGENTLPDKAIKG